MRYSYGEMDMDSMNKNKRPADCIQRFAILLVNMAVLTTSTYLIPLLLHTFREIRW